MNKKSRRGGAGFGYPRPTCRCCRTGMVRTGVVCDACIKAAVRLVSDSRKKLMEMENGK